MTKKELIETLINEMLEHGKAFIGTYEVQGQKAYELYKRLNKEVRKKSGGGMGVCWNYETGMAWIE